MTQMASAKQIELFNRLTNDRDFGQQNIESLRTQFAGLTQTSASAWIEKALELPKVPEGDEPPVVPPPF